jgi:dienelactone hydrolase
VVWTDGRGGASRDLYAQRLDAAGAPRWTPDGVPVCVAPNLQQAASIVPDGRGGAIVAWEDLRGGAAHDVYAQRIDASGRPRWAADGVALCAARGDQRLPTIAPDGAGGAIVTWYDGRGADPDIYAQRIDSSGAVRWAADGVALCVAARDQRLPTIAPDGAGGAIATWWDERAGHRDVYAQRVDAKGRTRWAANGIALCTAPGDQAYPIAIADGAGGAIVTWHDRRGGREFDVYAQRIDAKGRTRWTPNGVALCTAAGHQFHPKAAADGTGGAIVAWYDFRAGSQIDIYARRVNAAGEAQWTADGVALCTAPGNQHWPFVASDGAGGAIVTWQDARGGGNDVYAQRVGATGETLWSADGVAVCTAEREQDSARPVSDGAGGVIVAWSDDRAGSYDVHAQRLGPSGAIGWAEPPPAAPDARAPRATGLLFREVTVEGTRHRFAIWVPPGYDEARPWPCVVFLHGSGECGTDGERPTRVGLIPAVTRDPERWPAIVVVPQKPREAEEWEEREVLVLAALEAARREFHIDPDRVALTGLSQGGHGVWLIGARHPDRFSCLAPVCGYGRARVVAPRVAGLPVWAFHGLADDLVDPRDTQRIVEGVRAERRARGLDPEGARMTLYEGVNHGAWDRAYAEPELPGWMLAQRRAAR